MKKSLLTLIILSACSIASRAQTLPNTTWAAYSISNNALSLYFQFATTSLSFSSNNISYQQVSDYSESGNVLKLFNDVSGCGTDTARYTFLITNDTMRFTLISDTCQSRVQYFTTTYWVGLTVGISNNYLVSQLFVFPNPSSEGIFNFSFASPLQNETSVTISDMQGKILLIKKFSPGEKIYSLNLGEYACGIYFAKIDGEINEAVKLIR